MSRAISTHKRYQGFGYYTNTGVGIEAQNLAKFMSGEYAEAVARAVLLRPKTETLRKLTEVFKECCLDNWDGEGAAAIGLAAYREAFRLISLLPSMRQMPEIVPAPNGQIGLEWFVEKNQLLVVATAGRHSLAYASLEGTPQAVSGVLQFNDAIPQEIIEKLSRLSRLEHQ